MKWQIFRTTLWASVALLMCSTWMGVAIGQTGTPANLISEALKRYQNKTNYRAEVLQVYNQAATRTSLQYHRTVMGGAEHHTYAVMHEPYHQITIVDGVNIWNYLPDKLEYSQQPFRPTVVEPVEITSIQRLATFTIVDARELGNETVLIDGQSVPCGVFEATFETPGGRSKAKVWIEKSNSTVRKVSKFGQNGDSVTTLILSIEENQVFPDSQFAFVPPSNARKVEIARTPQEAVSEAKKRP